MSIQTQKKKKAKCLTLKVSVSAFKGSTLTNFFPPGIPRTGHDLGGNGGGCWRRRRAVHELLVRSDDTPGELIELIDNSPSVCLEKHGFLSPLLNFHPMSGLTPTGAKPGGRPSHLR
ncbi:hypothetical protein Bpfe_025787 [Biomphalaria pfeifferi]|uniref:Uncharacterized protein n=1 Tax=Biomphalaria pfeifferi TaxID=112525 RepID=A0AAD8AYI7_BIOPF|nr:hypothetical protein Bpfe_025787 [Biomphalaria pfeifferi]